MEQSSQNKMEQNPQTYKRAEKMTKLLKNTAKIAKL